MTIPVPPEIKVGIVGAGPGGLAAAIFLRRLPFVSVNVFDQATVLREIGAGIQLNENTWRLLGLLGAASSIEQFSKRDKLGALFVQQRNGRTGEIITEKYNTAEVDNPPRARIPRTALQNALLGQLPENYVQLQKKLKAVREISGGTYLSFHDGTEAGPYDLVIGADGIRSAVRHHIYPEHKLSYTGKVAYRVFIPQEKVAHIKGIPPGSCFWHTPTTHVYTNPIDNGLFEIATRALESEDYGSKVSWGQKADKARVIPHYSEYHETIRQIIEVPDDWLEFAIFGGPRLTRIVSNGRLALLGDASHPLSGAFGSGAAFAFEDAYVLAYVLNQAHNSGQPLSAALEEYDAIRGPRYESLYGVLDQFGVNAAAVKGLGLSEDETVNEIIRKNSLLESGFIYSYDITKVLAEREAAKATATVKTTVSLPVAAAVGA